MPDFKTIRITHNGKDQRIAGLYRTVKPSPGHPFWEFNYNAVGEKPAQVLYFTGNVMVVREQRKEVEK